MSIAFSRRSFSIVSWNARGLLVRRFQLRKKELASLSRFARRADFVLLQDVHGSEARIWDALGHFRYRFHVFADIPQRGSRGVAILARKKTCLDFDSLEFSRTVVGRVCRLVARAVPSNIGADFPPQTSVDELALYNTHHFRIYTSEHVGAYRQLS